MTRTPPSIGAAVFAVLAVVALAVAAAPARASTWNHKWSYLHFPANLEDQDSTYPARRLTLNGTYRWRAFSYHWAHPGQPSAKPRTVRLHGRYDWLDTLHKEGTRYRHTSTLTNVRTGGRVWLIHYETGRFGDGQYHWGSTLDNVLAGAT